MTEPDRYRRRPAEIEAMQWTGTNADALRAFAGQAFDTIDPEDRIEDPDQDAQLLVEASHWVGIKPGDWVLKFDGYFISKGDETFRAVWEPVAQSPADHAALRDRIAEALAAKFTRDGNVTDGMRVLENDPDLPAARRVLPLEAADVVVAMLPEVEEPPLSPDYQHPECGFHWHGKDGMDIPMRDGQPVCPRCELSKVEKRLQHFERRCVELREESLRRGKNVLDHSEKNGALEREIDGVRRQLGAEILRANHAEAELRRLAGEQPAPTPSTAPLAAGLPLVKGNCPACGHASLFLGSGGYVTCSIAECREPDAASTVLERTPSA